MIETIMAWILLFVGITTGESAWFIASGVFACACNLSSIENRIKENTKEK